MPMTLKFRSGNRLKHFLIVLMLLASIGRIVSGGNIALGSTSFSVTNISPGYIQPQGVQAVTVSGSGFSSLTSISLNGTPATFSVASDTELVFWTDSTPLSTYCSNVNNLPNPYAYNMPQTCDISIVLTNSSGTSITAKLTISDPLNYVPITPQRVADTRSILGNSFQGAGHQIGPNETLTIFVGNVINLPTPLNGVEGVEANITAVNASEQTFLTAHEGGTSVPPTSNLNISPGETVAALVDVPLSPNGTIDITNFQGNVDVVVDVEGFDVFSSYGYANSFAYSPITPQRILDTRTTNQITPNQGIVPINLPPSIVGSLGSPSIRQNMGFELNVTVTNATAPGWLVVGGSCEPFEMLTQNISLSSFTTSTLNWVADQTIANRVIACSNPTIQVYGGSVDVIVDLEGIYQPPTYSESIFGTQALSSLGTAIIESNAVFTEAGESFGTSTQSFVSMLNSGQGLISYLSASDESYSLQQVSTDTFGCSGSGIGYFCNGAALAIYDPAQLSCDYVLMNKSQTIYTELGDTVGPGTYIGIGPLDSPYGGCSISLASQVIIGHFANGPDIPNTQLVSSAPQIERDITRAATLVFNSDSNSFGISSQSFVGELNAVSSLNFVGPTSGSTIPSTVNSVALDCGVNTNSNCKVAVFGWPNQQNGFCNFLVDDQDPSFKGPVFGFSPTGIGVTALNAYPNGPGCALSGTFSGWTEDSTLVPAQFPDQDVYLPLTPTRLLDTRNSPGATNSTITVTPAELSNLVPSAIIGNVKALLVNLTVTTPSSSSGYVSVGSDAPSTTTSVLNYLPNETIANSVVIPLSSSGGIVIKLNGPTPPNLIIDIQGIYFGTSPRSIITTVATFPITTLNYALNTGLNFIYSSNRNSFPSNTASLLQANFSSPEYYIFTSSIPVDYGSISTLVDPSGQWVVLSSQNSAGGCAALLVIKKQLSGTGPWGETAPGEYNSTSPTVLNNCIASATAYPNP